GDVLEDGGLEPPARAVDAPAAREHPRPLDRLEDAVERLLADHRACRVLTRACDESRSELVVDLVEHHDAARGSAALPGVGEGRGKRPLDGTAEVGVVTDDERVLPAE